MRIHCLQHVPHEPPGTIVGWAHRRGHALTVTEMQAGGPLPAPDALDWLVVMGGPMNVYEEKNYPWLAPEKRLIESAIAHGKVVLGICLGAQLVADVLGAKVRRNSEREIGWFAVEKTEEAKRAHALGAHPETVEAFHWHGDTFDLPSGALHVARSEACKNQAFVYNDRVLALQYHLEMTRGIARRIAEASRGDLAPAPFVQRPDDFLRDDERFRRLEGTMNHLLSRLETLPIERR